MESLNNKVIVKGNDYIQFTTQTQFTVEVHPHYASVHPTSSSNYYEISKGDRDFFIMGDYAISRVETIEHLIKEKENLIREKECEKENALLRLKLKMIN